MSTNILIPFLVAAFAPTGLASLTFSSANNFSNVVAGSSFNVQWSGASGEVAVTLYNGTDFQEDPNDVYIVEDIASGLSSKSTSFNWDVPTELADSSDIQFYINVSDSSSEIKSPYFYILSASSINTPTSSTSISSATSIASSTSDGSPVETSSTSTATQSSSSDAPASSNTSAASHAGLSTGAKIGIGVGIALGVLLLGGLLGLFFICGKRAARKSSSEKPYEILKPELGTGEPQNRVAGQSTVGGGMPPEAMGTERVEMPSQHWAPVELEVR